MANQLRDRSPHPASAPVTWYWSAPRGVVVLDMRRLLSDIPRLSHLVVPCKDLPTRAGREVLARVCQLPPLPPRSGTSWPFKENVKEDDEMALRQYNGRSGAHKGNGRSGGRAAPKKDRNALGKEKGTEAERCIC